MTDRESKIEQINALEESIYALECEIGEFEDQISEARVGLRLLNQELEQILESLDLDDSIITEEEDREIRQMIEWARDERLPLWTDADVEKLLAEVARNHPAADLSPYDYRVQGQ